jgi:hypothetical protein
MTGRRLSLKFRHVLCNMGDILILEAVLDLRTHCVTNFRLRSFTLRHAPDRNVAISDHADELFILGHRQQASIKSSSLKPLHCESCRLV